MDFILAQERLCKHKNRSICRHTLTIKKTNRDTITEIFGYMTDFIGHHIFAIGLDWIGLC
jgi:hypothetical protein